jgi:hypothetical protein
MGLLDLMKQGSKGSMTGDTTHIYALGGQKIFVLLQNFYIETPFGVLTRSTWI